MKQKLYICNTLYQVINAISIADSFHDHKAMYFITDEVPDGNSLVENMKKIPALKKSYYIRVKQGKWVRPQYRFLLGEKGYSDVVDTLKKYVPDIAFDEVDEFFFANIGGFGVVLGMYLYRYKRVKKISMFEDGVSSYSRIYGDYIRNCIKPDNVVEIVKNKLFPMIYKWVKCYYLHDEKLIVWDVPYRLKEIRFDIGLKDTLNEIFDFSSMEDLYSEKVVFFEEAYYADGVRVPDIQIVEKLEKIYGRDNILVKIHPRNPDNRFKQLGYHTNHNVNIPWEVIALNIDLDNKVLVTISSTAILTTFLLYHPSCKLIIENKKVTIENTRLKYTFEVIDKLRDLYSDYFLSIDEIR